MVVRAKKGTFKQMGNCTNYHTDVKKKAKKVFFGFGRQESNFSGVLAAESWS